MEELLRLVGCAGRSRNYATTGGARPRVRRSRPALVPIHERSSGREATTEKECSRGAEGRSERAIRGATRSASASTPPASTPSASSPSQPPPSAEPAPSSAATPACAAQEAHTAPVATAHRRPKPGALGAKPGGLLPSGGEPAS